MAVAFLADAAVLNLAWVIVPLLAFLLLLLVVAMGERRFTRPNMEIPEQQLGPLSPYVRRMSDDASANGFVFGCYIGHAKPSIKICGTVWFSADRRILLMTNSGTVSGLRSKQTMIFSPTNDGTFLCTTDHLGESDPSGLFRFKRLWNGLLEDLLKKHNRRIENAVGRVSPFRESSAFDALTELYAQRTQRMVDKGLAKYIDGEQPCWRHTFFGAIHICGTFFSQLAEALPQFWRKYLRGAGSAV
jgi:hypothetical protein